MINYKGYGILLENMTDGLVEELTVSPLKIAGYGPEKVETYNVYRQNSTRFYMPKFYGISKFGPPSKSKERLGDPIALKFNGELFAHQVKFCNSILDEIGKNDACIASSGTGSGKTSMSLWILSQLKVKTLIIVHKEFLMDQWMQRIQQFLPDAKVGIIRQNTTTVEDKDIVIGMLQSISMKDYPIEIFDSFGLTIIDECHHVCTNSFSNALFKVSTKKMLGLSATPKRADGLTKVLNWFLGKILINEIQSNVENPEVKFVFVKKYSSGIEPKYNLYGKLILSNMITQLTEDNARNEVILSEIVEAYKLNRNIIMLTDRREHCEYIKSCLNDRGINEVGLYLGGMTEKELNSSNEQKIILATYSMAAEGYDNPKLDTLIMATGRSNVEQSCGRVLRRKNANNPLIIDIVDSEYLNNQYITRRKFYKKKNYVLNSSLKNSKERVEDDEEDECMF